MTGGELQHPFVVGEKYHNEDGAYTVVGITEPNMLIQYKDGRMLESSITLQARIWERIRDEAEAKSIEANAASREKRRSGNRGRAAWGRDFQGLVDTDFRLDLAGTTWRRREELGGLLALTLSQLSNEEFVSHAVPRRPQVHVVNQQHYNRGESMQVAKFLFDISDTGAYYGFYIEKSNEPMQSVWDWSYFIDSLARDAELQASALVSMQRQNLRWKVNVGSPDSDKDMYVAAENDSLMQQETGAQQWTPYSWSEFISALQTLPENRWCDLHLGANIDKQNAMAAGVALAHDVAKVYFALLPLYQAAVRR